MLKDLLASTEKKMKDRVEHARHTLATIRTGRASLAILDGVTVDYYGTQTPINQVATLTIPDPTLIVAQPWDASTIPAIEKAIRKSDLGLNPNNDGKAVKIPIPPLTEERRKEFEEERTHVRQHRREGNEAAKKLLKDKAISEDEEKRALVEIQKLTDRYIQAIDDLVKHKEKELLEV